MRSTDRPDTAETYDGDPYDEDYDGLSGETREDPYDEDGRGSWFSYAPMGLWPWAYGTEEGDRGATYDQDVGGEDGTWLDEGLITLLLVAGIVLFLFPEPATSALGVVLLVTGAVLWLLDWAL